MGWPTPGKMMILRGSNLFLRKPTTETTCTAWCLQFLSPPGPFFFLLGNFSTFKRFDRGADYLILQVEVDSMLFRGGSGCWRRWGNSQQHLPSPWRGFNDLAVQVDWRPETELIWVQLGLWSQYVPTQCSTMLNPRLGKTWGKPMKTLSFYQEKNTSRAKACRCWPDPESQPQDAPFDPWKMSTWHHLKPNDVLQWSLGNGIVCNLQALFPRFHLIHVWEPNRCCIGLTFNQGDAAVAFPTSWVQKIEKNTLVSHSHQIIKSAWAW